MKVCSTKELIVGEWLDDAGFMFWQMDLEFHVIRANKLFMDTFGNPVGFKCHEFMTGSADPCHGCAAQKIFKGKSQAACDVFAATRNGREIWLNHIAVPVRDASGKIIGASEMVVDISLQKRTRKWFEDSERRYRALLEQMPDVIFMLDEEGKFIYLNYEVEKFLGYSVKELLDTPLEKIVVTRADKDRVRSIADLDSESIWDREVGILARSGEKKYARIRCKRSRFDDLAETRYEGVMRDISGRKLLEQALSSSREELMSKVKIIEELYEHIIQTEKSEAIEQHTAEVAHELRQPLAIVGGFARRMVRGLEEGRPADPGTQKEYFKTIIREIDRLENILSNLISYTKKQVVCFQQVNPNHLVAYVIDINRDRMSENNIALTMRLSPKIKEAYIDPGRFQQVVRNLVTNAIEASPAGEEIVVETELSSGADEEFFEFRIRNGGRIIPQDELTKIFNPFFTTKKFGTGVGLTLSKRIVDDHHGIISVESTELGTVFTVRMPVNQPERAEN